MNRPLYQTDDDLSNESLIMEQLRLRWRLTTVNKLPISHGLDFSLMRGRDVIAYAEIKDRPGLTWGYGDGYYISTLKVTKAEQYRRDLGLPSVIAVRTKEGRIGWVDFQDRASGAIWAGRRDRGDSADMEPHCIYPWAKFHVLTEGSI